MADDQRPNAASTSEGDALGAAPTLAGGGSSKPPKERSGGSGGRRRRFGLVPLIVVGVLVLALAPSVLSTLQKTPRDKVGISYGGGPIEGSKFQKVVQPGSNLFFNGLFDKLYLYPADQQNYIISKVASQGSVQGADTVSAPTSDRVQVQYQAATFFKLNIDRLQDFHEQLGLKFQAYTPDGWKNMLQDTLRQQIESAIQQETRRYTVAQLFGDPEVLKTLQTEVRQTIAGQLTASLGQEYFCGPNYVPGGNCEPINFIIKKIEIPVTVSQAYEAIQARTSQAEAIEIVSAALKGAGPEYTKLVAVESGNTTFWILPDGTNVELPLPEGASPGAPTPTTPDSGSATTSTTTTTTTTP